MSYSKPEETNPFADDYDDVVQNNADFQNEPLNPFAEANSHGVNSYKPINEKPIDNDNAPSINLNVQEEQSNSKGWNFSSLKTTVFSGRTEQPQQQNVQKPHAVPETIVAVSGSSANREFEAQQKARELDAWEAQILKDKEDNLSRRERELAEREKALQLESQRSQNLNKKNFPPICPIMRHHIKEDIPSDLRALMRSILLLWSLSCLAIIYNIVVCLIIMINKSLNGNETTNFGVSFNYLVTVGVSSFFLWYMPVYHAFKKNNSFYYMLFLVFCGFHVLFLAYMSLGPGINSGSGGLINLISVATSKNAIVSILTAVDFGVFVSLTIFAIIIWFKVHSRYKKLGKTLKDVQNEAVKTIASSDAGRSMGKAAAGAYIKSATGDFA